MDEKEAGAESIFQSCVLSLPSVEDKSVWARCRNTSPIGKTDVEQNVI